MNHNVTARIPPPKITYVRDWAAYNAGSKLYDVWSSTLAQQVVASSLMPSDM